MKRTTMNTLQHLFKASALAVLSLVIIPSAHAQVQKPGVTRDFRPRYSVGSLSHDLSGSQGADPLVNFGASNTSEWGGGVDVSFGLWRDGNGLRFTYQKHQWNFAKPAEVTSSSPLPLTFRRVAAEAITIRDGGQRFGFGFEYRDTAGEYTTPYNVFPSESKVSARLSYGASKQLKEKLRFEYDVGLLLPLITWNSGQNTGYRKFGLYPDLSAMFVYQLNDSIDFSTGMEFVIERTYYNGSGGPAASGGRGLSQAVEAFNHINIPFEFRFRF
jgi:hypothetical protein